jgi:hypothetical protein
MVPKYNISLAEERELSLQRLKRICDAGFISVMDFWNNPLRIFAAHELAATIDPAMTVKMTVQFNCMSQRCIAICLHHLQSASFYLLLGKKKRPVFHER